MLKRTVNTAFFHVGFEMCDLGRLHGVPWQLDRLVAHTYRGNRYFSRFLLDLLCHLGPRIHSRCISWQWVIPFSIYCVWSALAHDSAGWSRMVWDLQSMPFQNTLPCHGVLCHSAQPYRMSVCSLEKSCDGWRQPPFPDSSLSWHSWRWNQHFYSCRYLWFPKCCLSEWFVSLWTSLSLAAWR